MPTKFKTSIGEMIFDIQYEANGSIRVDDTYHTYDIVPLQNGSFSLLLDGRSYVIRKIPNNTNGGENGLRSGSTTLLLDGIEITVMVDDERSLLLKSVLGRRIEKKISTTVTAPMPGLVTKVEVKEGDNVEIGTGLLILEAMKMENEVRSPLKGIVKSIDVTQGRPVEKGTLLVTIVERNE